MNLRKLALFVCAVVGLTATLAAQRATPGRSKAPPKAQAKTVTITGCVAQGIDADHYRLANAVRREQPPATTAVAGTSGKAGSDKVGASDRTGPYDLQGGEFKGHLGHRVEVVGTSVSTDQTTDTATSEGDKERKPLPTLNVQSVKMLSPTCS